MSIGAMTSSGFMIIFGLAGAAISLGFFWMMKYMPWAGFMIGLALILTGIRYMSGRTITLLLPVSGGKYVKRSWTGDLLFGIGYGTASLSCTLPIFLSVTGTAITGGLAGSTLTFFAYALGMGTVLMVLAITAALAHQGLALRVRKAGLYLNRFSSGVMVLSGTYVTFYWGIILFLPQTPGATRLITYADVIANPMRRWLGGQSGTIVLLGLALLMVLFLLWASWSRVIRKTKVTKPHKTTLPV